MAGLRNLVDAVLVNIDQVAIEKSGMRVISSRSLSIRAPVSFSLN